MTAEDIAGIEKELGCGICLEVDHHRTFVSLGCGHRMHKGCLHRAFWSDMKRLEVKFKRLDKWANYRCPMCRRFIDGISLSEMLPKGPEEQYTERRGEAIKQSYESFFNASEGREDFVAGVRADVRQSNGASDNTMFTNRASGSRAVEELMYIPLTYSTEDFEYEYLMVCHSDDTVEDLGTAWLRQLWTPGQEIDLFRERYFFTRMGNLLPWHRKLRAMGLKNGSAIRHDIPRIA
jgi:hypothetical protein